ncbi:MULTISPECIES: glycosyltransferase family 4 protein [unclassified Wenzhouxiangella]|uniref:glycosyltransferase family 4 protein n=1 Tax=unclassified Wenzhouxiangella TaxID=2613841 RepID=UPI000E32A352|nr:MULTISPECIES: glycosyltransferase family 4 protein [unclassified Wenzhouxiangella]RFF27649.1 glycosyltransferase family 1 protein [Wenzhouxiangella sp. 15181]RFP69742.1 glycosyltransferase family 1 protein [Wenzhouxiangella sp. 15190]
MSMSKPVAMLVSRNLPPLQGGMERLNQHVFLELRQACDVSIIGPRGAKRYLRDARRVQTCPVTPVSLFLACASVKAVRSARRHHPVLILAGSGANSVPAWLAAKLSNVPWGVYLHGLDVLTENYWYQRVMLPIIRKADFFLANSRATAEVAQKAGISGELIHILHPGVTFPEEIPSSEAVLEWRQSINVGDRPLILSVGRLMRRKGLREFISNAFPAILTQYPRAMLVIVGSEPSGALKKDAVGTAELRDAAAASGVSRNVVFLGKIDDEALRMAYCASSIHVFPVLELSGDMEGFGMVAIEAAAHGLPTIAFQTGGVSDSVRDGVSGSLIPPGEYDQFARHCCQWLAQSGDVLARKQCRQFSKQFEWREFGKSLRAIPPIRKALT